MTLSAIRLPGIALTGAMLAMLPPGFGADSFAWGPAVNGLRLAAALGDDPSKPTLRIAFQNVGSETQEVVLGHEAGGAIYDSLKFIAIAPDGKQQELLHRSLYRAVGGLILPFSAVLNPGGTHELEFPLKDIIYASRTTVMLDDLLKQGYSVQVRFEANQFDANWERLARPWIGTLTSTGISQAR
jgi:hypothetical protein